jgi:hypothetical protein
MTLNKKTGNYIEGSCAEIYHGIFMWQFRGIPLGWISGVLAGTRTAHLPKTKEKPYRLRHISHFMSNSFVQI